MGLYSNIKPIFDVKPMGFYAREYGTMWNKLLILVGLCLMAPDVWLVVQHKTTVNEFNMHVHRIGFWSIAIAIKNR